MAQKLAKIGLVFVLLGCTKNPIAEDTRAGRYQEPGETSKTGTTGTTESLADPSTTETTAEVSQTSQLGLMELEVTSAGLESLAVVGSDGKTIPSAELVVALKTGTTPPTDCTMDSADQVVPGAKLGDMVLSPNTDYSLSVCQRLGQNQMTPILASKTFTSKASTVELSNEPTFADDTLTLQTELSKNPKKTEYLFKVTQVSGEQFYQFDSGLAQQEIWTRLSSEYEEVSLNEDGSVTLTMSGLPQSFQLQMYARNTSGDLADPLEVFVASGSMADSSSYFAGAADLSTEAMQKDQDPEVQAEQAEQSLAEAQQAAKENPGSEEAEEAVEAAMAADERAQEQLAVVENAERAEAKSNAGSEDTSEENNTTTPASEAAEPEVVVVADEPEVVAEPEVVVVANAPEVAGEASGKEKSNNGNGKDKKEKSNNGNGNGNAYGQQDQPANEINGGKGKGKNKN